MTMDGDLEFMGDIPLHQFGEPFLLFQQLSGK